MTEHRLQEQAEQERIQSRVSLWEIEEQRARLWAPAPAASQVFKQSDQIWVMGLDLAGRYIAHTLAGSQTIPPVRYLLHTRRLHKAWEANRRLTVYRGYDRTARDRVVGEDISPDAQFQRDDIIENLIVTVPAGHVVQALESIKHRLDHRSSICLVNNGLGVAEALIEAYFPNELTRPVFILGHLTTALGYTDDRFSVAEVRPGRLYLSLFSSYTREPGTQFRIKRHPPLERVARATHFLRLLTAMPGLNATGHPMHDFLRYKLPTIAFRSTADPLAALCDCTYDRLRSNTYARQLIDHLIGELSGVVSRLPECRHSARFRQSAMVSSLRKEVFKKLMLQRTADSRMRSRVSRGWQTDIDFLTGYFVKRGRELQADVSALDSVMWAVKAKQSVTLEQLASEIPFETT